RRGRGDGASRSLDPVQSQRLREEDGHLPARQRRVGTVVASAAPARDSRGGERLDVLEEETPGGDVGEGRLRRSIADATPPADLDAAETERRAFVHGDDHAVRDVIAHAVEIDVHLVVEWIAELVPADPEVPE